jgi:hypothetical protein
MTDEQQPPPAQRPARPLFGYRDTGAEPKRSRYTITRAWLILLVLIALYLSWTLVVYFFEPGLR